jgi:hypothetical protein
MQDEYGDTGTILTKGSDRNRIFFKPTKDGIAYKYFSNLETIYKVDANEGDKYKEWLLKHEMPKIKNDLEDALVKEYINLDNADGFWEEVTKLQDNFKKFNEAINKKYNSLEFLKAYI